MSLKEDSQYDSSQVLPRVYDNNKGVLKVLPTDGTNDLKINPDGSIDVNSTGGGCDLTQVEASLDAILVEAEEANVTLDAVLVEAEATNTTLTSIDAALSGPMVTAGTDDGTLTGNVFINVNNVKNQILQAEDRDMAINYADFGTKDQRITSLVYTSPTFPGIIATKTLNYVLDSGKYRRTTIIWSVT
jgi:hypothetical protein